MDGDRRRVHVVRAAGLLGLLFAGYCGIARAGPLEDYVQRPDAAYGWTLQGTSADLFADYYHLRLVSQQWLNAQQVDRPLWVHELRLAQPRGIWCGDSARNSTAAVLVISGGRNKPESEARLSVPLGSGLVARAFCRPVIELRQIPNQPLRFVDETEDRKEDAVIAYTFDRYLRGEAGDWPVQMAMVKSVVQAMNAVQAFARTRDDVPDVSSFVLIGASKRGWTAWLTAAVDARVRAIVPVSIDIPNIRKQFPHHFASYGEYSPALADYQAFGIGCRIASERGQALLDIVDPFSYRERLIQPKLILNSAGDEFFVSDSWRFYYDGLRGDNRLRYTPNTDHDQGDAQARYEHIKMARNWINDILAGRQPPRLDWRREADGTLLVEPSEPPRAVRLWTALNSETRDFRLQTIGPAWQSHALAADKDGRYRVQLAAPAKGWQATMVEAEFGDSSDERQVFTTGVYVLPETLPFADANTRCEEGPAGGSGEAAAAP
jgi:PhoPQ-activated pathogenicity-related protein